MKKTIKVIYISFGILPICWLAIVFLTYLNVAQKIGYFPHYGDSDNSPFDSSIAIYNLSNTLFYIIKLNFLIIPFVIFLQNLMWKKNVISLKPDYKLIFVTLSPYFILIMCFIFPITSKVISWYLFN